MIFLPHRSGTQHAQIGMSYWSVSSRLESREALALSAGNQYGTAHLSTEGMYCGNLLVNLLDGHRLVQKLGYADLTFDGHIYWRGCQNFKCLQPHG
jgi:hypothetical protein